jgi:hypothetical protein
MTQGIERLGADRPQRRRWTWSPDKRAAHARRMAAFAVARGRNRPLFVDPHKGLWHLDRGDYRSFEESVARARDPARRVSQENWKRFRP